MFTTKKQVDQHVKTSLAKLRSENEKRLRGLVIAKMYFKIGEYASAQHYVSGYLSSNEAAPQAHRLLGDCYCKLKQSEKALASYQRSYQLDNKQTDLLIDACNLILSEDMTGSKSNAKFWCEAAGNARVQHESVFNLKLRLLATDDNKDTKQVEEMIVKEINNRPSEVSPRLQLVNYYISKNRAEDAFKYISDTNHRNPGQFLNSLDWYAAIHKAMNLYRQATDVVLSKNWDYWLLSITAVDRQLSLGLAQEQNLSSQQSAQLQHCQTLLFELDQMLYTAAQLSFPVRPELAAQMITHFQGQFLLHVASYLFKRERTLNLNQWWNTTNNALPMLFIAFRLGIAATEDPWLKQANDATRELVRMWQRQGAFRCSQAGRTLLSSIQNSADGNKVVAPFNLAEEVTDAARKHCSSQNWTTTLYRNLFMNGDQISKMGTSFMATSNLLAEPTFELPTVLRIQMYERIAEALQSDSLPQLVYLYLHNEKLCECDFNVFSGLELTASNIFNCSAATLNKLDIETFLLSTVMQTKSRLECDMKGMNDGPRPLTLPYANMARLLCTEEQLRWWQSAFNSTRGIGTDETWNVREVLQDGIEAVRCVGTPKLDIMIALLVGDVLKQKTDNNLAIDLTTKKTYEQRVENIFLCALHLLKTQSTAAVTDKRRLFQYQSKTNVLGTEQCNSLIEGAIVFLSEHLFKNGDYENCIEILTSIQLPYATYYIAEAYKKLDESNRNNRTPPRSGSYQNKIKEYLGQTQKLLASGSKKTHALRTVVNNELKKLQYSDLNISNASVDDDINVSYSGVMNRSRQDSQVADQVTNLTSLVTQLTMQNTMLQTELSDIKKMLQQQKETAAATESSSAARDSVYRMEEQQRMAALAMANELMSGRYNMGAYPMAAYPQIAFQTPPQYPPHLRAATPIYGQDGAGMPMNQTPNTRGAYESITGALNLPPMTAQQQPLYYSPGNVASGHSVLTSQLQQPPIPLATSSTLNQQSMDQVFPNNSILKTWNRTYNNEPVEKAAPANVVITSSDPVPLHNTVTAQKLLSVTIPPQHIKNFGPTGAQQFPTTLTGSFNNHSSTLSHTATNISGDEDETATEEDYYDQSVDYSAEPSIDAVEEETAVRIPEIPKHETICFSGHTKLYRFLNKEWKERGVGDLKITKNALDNKTRLTMNRDQSGVLCANHDITVESKLSSNDAQGTSLVWAGNDFSDGVLKAEKFCAKFKSAEAANAFKDAFEKAVNDLVGLVANIPIAETKKIEPVVTTAVSVAPQPTTLNLAFGEPAPNKPSPFTGFSFGGAASNASPEKTFGTLFSNIPKPASTNSPFGFNAAVDLAIKVPAQETSPAKANEENEDDYVPTAQFKPVIALPSLVDVKTGEEDEEVAFEHRAKLLRFDPSTKEWKERGLGNIRVLVHKNDPSQVRLLMRREQVLKLACNQRIAKDQEFKKMPNSETALTWYAQDFAENELKTELFAIRFKTSDICKSFHDAILTAQKNMTTPSATTIPAPVKKEGEKKGFGDMFKKQVGSWECKACLIMNKSEVVHCVACDSPKDDTVPKKETKLKGLDLSGVKPGQFSFGFGVKPAVAPAASTTVPTDSKPAATSASDTAKGFGDAFKPKAGSWECQTCYITNSGDAVSCISCSTPKDGTEVKDIKTGFSFGPVKSSFSFGAAVTTSATGVATNSTSTFSNLFNTSTTTTSTPAATTTGLFGQAPAAPTNGPSFKLEANPTFNFVFKPKSPGKVKSPQNMANGNGGGEEDAESGDENIEEENTAYFTPVIPLPEKVESKTGEEDEEVLYSHRAKLFRYTDGEWKERGLGDVKILKHMLTGKLRVVMRREQVLKICLNHALDSDVEYVVKDNKSWHFIVNDFSEGVFELCQFCLRFKTADIAYDFKVAIDEALKDLNVSSAHDDTVVTEDGDDEEERKLVRELKLPERFFAYVHAQQCPGCRGCNDDDFVFASSVTPEAQTDDLPLQMPALPAKSTTLSKPIFGGFDQSQTKTFSPNSSTLFGGATMFSGSPIKNTSASIFGGTPPGQVSAFGSNASPAADTTAAPAVTGASLFSGFNKGFGSGGAIFGSTTFGSIAPAASTTDAQPLFGGATQSLTTPAENPLSKSPASIFGQNSFGSTAPSTFGSFNFGTAAQSLTFDKIKEAETKKDDTQPPAAAENIFKMDSSFSFATLAQQGSGTGFSGDKPEVVASGGSGFFGLSNTNDFRHFDNPAAQSNGNGDAGDGSVEDANYDPHYEPIIALPEEITVSTGEEEETKLFGERGCLYRFDATNKEWKERGVGEFKILHHPGKGTYRFVMRREQIFKLVLNQGISAEFEFKPLNKTGKSYCWAAMNHAEQPGVLEQLAVRFKNTDIASKFEEVVNNCVSNLQD